MKTVFLICAIAQCGPGGCPPSGYGIGLGGYSPYGTSGINMGISPYGRQRSQPQGNRQYGPGNCRPGCPGNCGCGCGDHDEVAQPRQPDWAPTQPRQPYSDYEDRPYDMPPYNRRSGNPKPQDTFAENPAPKPTFTHTTPNKTDGFAERKDGKAYLFFITAKWCKPACPRFYNDFADNTEFGKKLREHYIIIVVDWDEYGGAKGELIKKIEKLSGEKVSTLPYFYAPKGNICGQGYSVNDQQKFFDLFIPSPQEEPTSPSLTPIPDQPKASAPTIDYDKLADLAASRIIVDYTEINKYIDSRSTIDYDKLVNLVIQKLPPQEKVDYSKIKVPEVDYSKIKVPEIKQEPIDYDRLASLVVSKMPGVDLDSLVPKVMERLPKEQIYYDLKNLSKKKD